MATVKTLAEQLRDLRIKYTKQISDIEASYADALARNKERTAKIKKADYVSKFIERYRSFAESLQSVYAQIVQIEEKTHGLKFKVSEYIKTIRAEKFAPPQAETFFGELVKRCADCVRELEKDKPFETYEEHLKNFCSMLVTAKYFADNAEKILADSGIPESERAADLAEAAKQLKEIKENRARDLALENLPCYGELSAFIGEIKSSSTKIKSDMLGSDSFYYDKSYKYLLGFWKDKIADEDVEFAKNVLGLSSSELSSQPIYFDPQNGVNNIIINVRGSDFKSGRYFELVKRLYFTIMSRLRKNSLKYSSVACEKVSKGTVKTFHNTIHDTFDNGKDVSRSLYVGGDCVDDKSGIKALLDSLGKKDIDVKTKLKGKRNVYDYNRSADEDPVALRMLYVDCYPSGFSSTYGAGYDDLWQVMYDNVGSGEFVVVTQNVDGAFDEQLKMLDASDEDLHSLVIDYTDPKNPAVNGRAAILDTALPEFQEWEFWEKLNDYYSRKETFTTKEMLNDVDNSYKSVTDTSGGVIRVPIGKSGDKLMTLDFDTRSACHSFIYAASGKGKTSFLHNLIISLCYNFSPEEVNFYIADFKNELEIYASKEKRIPHVKYYLAKDPAADNERNAVNWIDMIKMIEQVRDDRQKEIDRLRAETKQNISDIVEYNQLSKKKMPYLFVLIDEWQGVLDLNKNNRGIQKDFVGVLNAILSLARSVGIVLILTGQQSLDTFEVSDNNIKNYIYLSMPPEKIQSDRKKTEEDEAYLSVEKEGRVIIKCNKVVSRFRTAYAGSAKVKVEPVLFDMICGRYSSVKAEPVIAGGSVEPFYISQKSSPSYESMAEFAKDGGNKADEDSYPVYVGVTTSFARPVAVNFSYNKDYCGFMMRSKDGDRINLFLRSLCVSFLYKTAYGIKSANAKYAAEGVKQRIKFFATKRNYNDDIGSDIVEPYADVGGQIEHFDVKNDLYGACKAIMDLRELYLKRKKADLDGGEKCLPVLAVIHELDWLLDRDALIAACNGGQTPSAQTNVDWESQVPEDAIQKTISMIKFLPGNRGKTPEELRKEALRMEVANLKKKQGGAPSPAREKFSASDVVAAFKELYDKGNAYGIFLFVASQSAFDLSSFRRELPNKEGLNKNAVFGCYSEALSGFGTGDEEIADVSSVCYVGSGKIKTRIYQIELEDDKAFMRDLACKIKE